MSGTHTTLLGTAQWAVLALHCTTLHRTALHCTALHCTALHCTALLESHINKAFAGCLKRLIYDKHNFPATSGHYRTHYRTQYRRHFLTNYLQLCLTNNIKKLIIQHNLHSCLPTIHRNAVVVIMLVYYKCVML
jgi:hypothetical protein